MIRKFHFISLIVIHSLTLACHQSDKQNMLATAGNSLNTHRPEELHQDTFLEMGKNASKTNVTKEKKLNSSLPNTQGFWPKNTFIWENQERRFDYFVPSKATSTAKLPLVIVLHGHGANVEITTGKTRAAAPQSEWLTLAEKKSFLVLYPEGITSPDKLQGWNDCRSDATTNPETDDVGFLLKLLELLKQELPIDSNRVYVTGTSNGGHMAIRLALEAPEKFAAIAPILGAMPANSECADKLASMPILFMNGTKDPIMPYLGGSMGANGNRGRVLSTKDSVQFWSNRNQTQRIAQTINLPNTNLFDASRIKLIRYLNHQNDRDVWLVEISGGGHAEPSKKHQYSWLFESQVIGKQNHDVEMAEIVWSFFKTRIK